ncbi:aminotransferase class III-fold pyridoxal phosphate-dependent enzyme, partial [Streptomyces sp. G-G2]|uniref:aminotransferase class III-fold pyridoxal phosphate-dependent enzyme n=1 Tax=Streptomyces sp. G-G2 TaxID=3046201 RepID=UPI0024BA77FC
MTPHAPHAASHAVAAAHADPHAGAAVKAADRAHVFHSWSAQALIDPLAVAGAEGSYFWDYEGKHYLDFASQLVNTNIGHQHPKVVAAIQEQAAKLCTLAPGFAVDVRSEAARLIAERTPG